MIIAGTGHRPDKLGGYSHDAFQHLVKIAKDFIFEFRPDKIISGMALGWDQALATAAVKTKTPFIAAVPFKGQESMWNVPAQAFYNSLLSRAEQVVYVCSEGYSPDKMQIRNQWMVDNCDLVLTIWDGTSGGTKNCLVYAGILGKPIVNLHLEFLL